MELSPKIAVPIHGRRQEMKQFENIVKNVQPEVEVIIPEKFEPIKISVKN
jgi:mRNA degradation ribonuclease J1/J2